MFREKSVNPVADTVAEIGRDGSGALQPSHQEFELAVAYSSEPEAAKIGSQREWHDPFLVRDVRIQRHRSLTYWVPC